MKYLLCAVLYMGKRKRALASRAQCYSERHAYHQQQHHHQQLIIIIVIISTIINISISVSIDITCILFQKQFRVLSIHTMQ